MPAYVIVEITVLDPEKYERYRLLAPPSIAEYGGLSKVMPVYATIFLIMTMSSIGLPASSSDSRRRNEPSPSVAKTSATVRPTSGTTRPTV